MGRFFIVLTGMSLSVSLTSGCATQKINSPMDFMRNIGFMKKSEDVLAKADNDKQPAPEKKIARSSPFRKASAIKAREKKVQAREVKSVADTKTNSGMANLTSKPGQTKRTTHNAELLVLIERELKDEPPAERDKLYNEWKSLDPVFVRELIRMRRASHQMARNAPSSRPETVSYNNTDRYPGQPSTPRYGNSNPGANRNAFPAVGHGGDMRYSAPPPRSPTITGLGTNPWNVNYGAAQPRPTYPGRAPSAQVSYQTPPPQNMNNGYPQYAGNVSNPQFQGQPGGFNQGLPRQQQPQITFVAPGDRQVQSGYGTQPGNPMRTRGYPAQQQQTTQQLLPQPRASQPHSPNTFNHNPALGMPSPNLGFQNVSTQQRFPGNAQAAVNAQPQTYNGQNEVPTLPTGPLPNVVESPTIPEINIQPKSAPLPQGRLSEKFADNPSGAWNGNLQTLLGQVEQSIGQLQIGTTESEKNQYIERHVYLRMLYLMAGQKSRAMEPIPGLGSADQEFWQQVFWGVANYFSIKEMPDASDRATQTIAQLRIAIQKLQEEARLELRNVEFSRNIASFGNYTKFERDEFSPGQPVLIYAEVMNFKSEPTGSQYRTILKSTIQILTPDGREVERMVFPATEDLCRNYRSDYFHSYEFTIPQQASLGPHVLKLTVEDQLKKKVATYTRNFTVR